MVFQIHLKIYPEHGVKLTYEGGEQSSFDHMQNPNVAHHSWLPDAEGFRFVSLRIYFQL